MTQKRTGEPWMTSGDYGRALPFFTVNLVVSDLARSVAFYTNVLGATLTYSDEDFAALRLRELEFMLHADHTYDHHPWHQHLTSGQRRGLGAELRLFQTDPDALEARAKQHGATFLQPCKDMPHGWRDVIVADPDGCAWAVGAATQKK
jgi:uncharacterized glyoxalase superfamily protein PhnB